MTRNTVKSGDPGTSTGLRAAQVLLITKIMVVPENFPNDRVTVLGIRGTNYVRLKILPFSESLRTTKRVGGCDFILVCKNEDTSGQV